MKRKIGASILCVGLAANAFGQFSSGFESGDYTASATGEELNGQQDFYNPLPTTSVSANVYTYAGNDLGVVANSTGGEQFVGAVGPANNFFARSQRDHDFGNGGTWKASVDIAVLFTGTLPTVQNVGSFAAADYPENKSAIMLSRWDNTANPTAWNADMVWMNAAGGQLIEQVPDAAFQGLELNKWYRRSITIDFNTNRVVEVTITDIDGGNTTSYQPADRYVAGGENSNLPLPFAFRFFAGGTVAGNTMCFDNLDLEKVSTTECPKKPKIKAKYKGKKGKASITASKLTAGDTYDIVVRDVTGAEVSRQTETAPGSGKIKVSVKKLDCNNAPHTAELEASGVVCKSSEFKKTCG